MEHFGANEHCRVCLLHFGTNGCYHGIALLPFASTQSAILEGTARTSSELVAVPTAEEATASHWSCCQQEAWRMLHVIAKFAAVRTPVGTKKRFRKGMASI